MDPITLDPIRLTQPAYFRLLVKLQLRKSGWMYLLLLVMGGLLLSLYDGEPFHLFLICFSFGWPVTRVPKPSNGWPGPVTAACRWVARPSTASSPWSRT